MLLLSSRNDGQSPGLAFCHNVLLGALMGNLGVSKTTRLGEGMKLRENLKKLRWRTETCLLGPKKRKRLF